jgi:hypothetical protein
MRYDYFESANKEFKAQKEYFNKVLITDNRIPKKEFPKLRKIEPINEHYEKNTLAHYLARYGYMFSIDELVTLKNPSNANGDTLAHFMARNGFKFKFEDLIALKNPSNNNDYSIAHELYEKGERYSFNEVVRLLELGTSPEWTLAHLMAKAGHQFSFDELLVMLELTKGCHISIADIMLSNGNEFSITEMEKLTEYPNGMGLTVADISKLRGRKFSKDNQKILGIEWKQIYFSHYIFYTFSNNFPLFAEYKYRCPICGSKLFNINIEPSKAPYIDLNLLIPSHEYSELSLCQQCHWWYIFQRWLENEIGRCADYYIVADKADKVYTNEHLPDPWLRS